MNKTVLLFGGILLFLAAVAQQANTLVNQGNEFYKQGAYDIAAAYYRRAIEKDPANHVAHYNLANALYRHKKFQGAIDAYKESAKTQGPNLKAASYYNEGVVFSYLKNTEKAIESYKKALRINPDDKEARENLQKALSELKKQQQQKQQNQQQNQSNMSQKEVERRLKMLQEKERQLQQQLNQKGSGGNQQKDW